MDNNDLFVVIVPAQRLSDALVCKLDGTTKRGMREPQTLTINDTAVLKMVLDALLSPCDKYTGAFNRIGSLVKIVVLKAKKTRAGSTSYSEEDLDALIDIV